MAKEKHTFIFRADYLAKNPLRSIPMERRALHIALISSQPKKDSALGTLIPQLEERNIRIDQVQNLGELRFQEDVALRAYDAIIFHASQDGSGSKYILSVGEIRAQSDLVDMPLIVVSDQKSGTHRSRLYDEGADVVFSFEVTTDEVEAMLYSLIRKTKQKKYLSTSSAFSMEEEDSLIHTYQKCPFPVVILHDDKAVRWMNNAALRAFGINNLFDHRHREYLENLSNTLSPLCAEESSEKNPKTNTIIIESTSGNREWWRTAVAKFYKKDVSSPTNNNRLSKISGYVFFLKARAREHILEQRADYIAQLEAMALRTSACAHTIIQEDEDGIILNPYQRIYTYLAQSKKKANLNSVFTSLLEYFDPVITPEITINVRASVDQKVDLTFGDAFELFGHVLINAIGYLMSRGTITIECSHHEAGLGTSVLITASSPMRARLLPILDLETLQEEHIMANPEMATSGSQLTSRFNRIREITAAYRTELLFRTTDDDTLKLKVNLPTSFTNT